jgi:hypothetical protein
MFLPRIFKSLELSVRERETHELLELNEKTKEYGLVLTPDEIKEILTVRDQVLHSYGRVELGIEVSKALIEQFCTSPYLDKDHYASTLMELHEIFYDLKNETEDDIADAELIDLLKKSFDEECAGSLELLKSRMEEFARQFRLEAVKTLEEGDEGA